VVPRVEVKWDRDFNCYDFMIKDLEATVADYEECLLRMFASTEAKRGYAPSCAGCSFCCRGRLPLTHIDVLRFQSGGVGAGLGWKDWVEQYAVVEELGECLDITLRLGPEGICLFWDQESGLCKVYPLRPLICRTYICWPVSRRAEQLRSRIVNAGEDELVRLYLSHTGGPSGPEGPFTGKRAYQEILLRELCSRRLLHALALLE